jgi:chemotaxis protein CheX
MENAQAVVYDVVRETWGLFLGIEIGPAEPYDAPKGDDILNASVHINGAWQGKVVISASASLSRTITSILLEIEPTELCAQDLHDALGELTNVTAGNVKVILPAPSHLSMPQIAIGSRVMQGNQVAGFACDCAGERLYVLLEQPS